MRDNCMCSKLCHTSKIQTYKSQPFTFHFLNQNQENVWAKDLFRHQCLYLLVQISKTWSVLPFFKLSMDQSQNRFFFFFFHIRVYISSVMKKINLPDLRSEHRLLRQHFHSFSHFTLSCTMPE